MQYRKDKKGRDLSLLGYGCMRFTRKGNAIDLDKAEREVTAAIEGGVNYLDTAYIYPGNEAAVGEILRRNGRRDQVYLATKLPHYLIKSVEGAEKIFREELRRLGTEEIPVIGVHQLLERGGAAMIGEPDVPDLPALQLPGDPVLHPQALQLLPGGSVGKHVHEVAPARRGA